MKARRSQPQAFSFERRANVYNVTDRTYIRNINNAGRYNPGTPRSFLFSSADRF